MLFFFVFLVPICVDLPARFERDDIQIHTSGPYTERVFLGTLVLHDLFVLVVPAFLPDRLQRQEGRRQQKQM